MVIVNIVGGLGNQMFQYAFAYALSRRIKDQVKLDVSAFKSYSLRIYQLDSFCIEINTATENECFRLKYQKESFFQKIIRKIIKKPRPLAKTYYHESCFNLDKHVFNLGSDYYFEGYWQSEKYFQEYRSDLLKMFTLKKDFDIKSLGYQRLILNSQAISIHIRRGDYVNNPKTNSVHGTCSLDYYKNAISHITNLIKNPFFFVFSDDLIWAKNNLTINAPIIFIELDHENCDCEELILMSQCKHNIIANSSFSWWGAWLNQNPDKIVIAPLLWFRDKSRNTDDLIPETWIRI